MMKQRMWQNNHATRGETTIVDNKNHNQTRKTQARNKAIGFCCVLLAEKPPTTTHCISSAASDVYKRQQLSGTLVVEQKMGLMQEAVEALFGCSSQQRAAGLLLDRWIPDEDWVRQI